MDMQKFCGYGSGVKKSISAHLWQVLYTLKELFVLGDNFLNERGGQWFWCWVASWRKHVVQHFDGMLLVFLTYAMHHITIAL